MGFTINQMMCQRHGKKIAGKCMWCGKPLCKNCDFKNKETKMYCSDCLTKLSNTPGLKEKYSGITKKDTSTIRKI